MADEKTNVMRTLDQKKIPYTPCYYPAGDPPPDGMTVAQLTGLKPETVFKTLVTTGASGRHYVFVVPVCRALDLKAAAKAVREKSVAMLRQAELLPLTGYVHGGCSPVGMKKLLPTVIDASAEALPEMTVNGGRVGTQVTLEPSRLAALIRARFAEVAGEG
ncbi:MAG: Cys-tRNA(Pro) deacylase [Clostridia bacterium]|nr:Cys-tRNA(Pro) deacylase [Clostridia bacterium]